MLKIPVTAALLLVVLLASTAIFALPARGRVIDSGGQGAALVLVEFTHPGVGEESEPGVEGEEGEPGVEGEEGADEVVAAAWTDDYGNFGVDVPEGGYTVIVSDGEEGGNETVFSWVSVDANGTLNPPVLEIDW